MKFNQVHQPNRFERLHKQLVSIRCSLTNAEYPGSDEWCGGDIDPHNFYYRSHDGKIEVHVTVNK
jgi:hypothetical protein